MEIIVFSEILLIIALVFLMLVALRVSAHSYATMGLIGASVLTMIAVLALVIFDKLNYIIFNFDIALALMLFGFVGTIVFAYVLGGYE